jgi:class 3 adenylate cyclase
MNKLPDHGKRNYMAKTFNALTGSKVSDRNNRTDVNQVSAMEPVLLKRKLAAVLLADVVGYSRLMSIDEEKTHVALADYVKEIIEPKVTEQGGRMIRAFVDRGLGPGAVRKESPPAAC